MFKTHTHTQIHLKEPIYLQKGTSSSLSLSISFEIGQNTKETKEKAIVNSIFVCALNIHDACHAFIWKGEGQNERVCMLQCERSIAMNLGTLESSSFWGRNRGNCADCGRNCVLRANSFCERSEISFMRKNVVFMF